jgi:hypothetical protein
MYVQLKELECALTIFLTSEQNNLGGIPWGIELIGYKKLLLY